MNMKPNTKTGAAAAAILSKADPNAPVFKMLGPSLLAIKAGTIFAGLTIAEDTPVSLHLNEKGEPGYIVGADYAVIISGGQLGITRAMGIPQDDAVQGSLVLGGFHFAPGGCAAARSGGDTIPQINPFSLWDRNFRPACPDPRGMAFIPPRQCWVDIYLTASDHLVNGTSQFGVKIADGDDQPENPHGKRCKKFDYETACAVVAHHGKTLLSFEDFIAAAYGVTEKSSADDDPEITGLDAPRTSKFGLLQVTGNMWQWGHDGDPDEPRASIFGGSWMGGQVAGSRCAYVACHWPDFSNDGFGARARSDHLQPV